MRTLLLAVLLAGIGCIAYQRYEWRLLVRECNTMRRNNIINNQYCIGIPPKGDPK